MATNPTPYVAKTEQELQAIAARRYQSTYDQQRLGATQAQLATDLALQQQAGSLDRTYGKQLEQSAAGYRQAYSQADRGMLQRGMQRSSYGASTLGNISLAGQKAQDEILGAKTEQLGNIEQQRALSARQLADQLRQYGTSQQNDTMAYADELEGKEYDRGMQAWQAAQGQENWDRNFGLQSQQVQNQQNQWQQGFTADQQQLGVQNQQWQQGFTADQQQLGVQNQQWDRNFGLQSQQVQNQQNQWQQGFTADQQQLGVQNQQWQQNFSEATRQFNAGLTLDEKQMNQSQENWVKEFAQSVSQTDRAFAEQVRQFGESMSADEKRMAMTAEQFQQNFAEQVRQFNVQHPATTAGTSSGTGGTTPAWQTAGFKTYADYTAAAGKSAADFYKVAGSGDDSFLSDLATAGGAVSADATKAALLSQQRYLSSTGPAMMTKATITPATAAPLTKVREYTR